MLHDIGETNGEFILTPNQFEKFLIAHRNDNFIRLENLCQSHNIIALTIDDVPVGFYKYGFPLLKKYKIPFTIFVNIELLNAPGFITTEMLKEMQTSGLATIGSHGMTHTFYRELSLDEKEQYLKQSKEILERICGCEISSFAFPYGSIYACGLKDRNLVSKYYRYGFGTISSPITIPSLLPQYFLPRINITSDNFDKL